ncbi:ATP-binding protein [Ramlibacter sp. H39-3-26]|uniref:HAMP domain-containing sensor histidine kinase n=1 Tax=Curvibacter soli TaxID=3031331 RepID=UPI0023DC49CB|nr:ATP-binding protein [Ramlibacter sp. H39-3-26]MDF1484762.1 ATP-binding protein [Ramlibacter sp. H39-3-26]
MNGGRRRIGSFQQLLLVAFLLIAGLLGGISLHTAFTFDGLMAQSNGFSARALELSAAAQALAERSATMERAARQSMVLGDAMLRRRFDEAARDGRQTLARLEPDDVPPELAARWRDQLALIGNLIDGPQDTALERDRRVAAEFRELESVNTAIGQEVQHSIEQRNAALRAQLEDSRARLVRLMVGAIVLAVGLAIWFGVWLARPFKRLERAIVGLGENRLDEPIDIHGPVDVQRVGQQLEWLRLRLTELDADKARFLRHISHELKTPLAALREGVALLEDGVTGALTSGQREVATILRQNTVVLQEQIEALLRFNAAAFEARQLKREKTDLLQLLEDQVDLQRLQWQAHGLKVRVDGEPLGMPVDAGKIATAVANLLSNAIRFSPHGGRITLALSHTDGAVCIDISDQGPGVAEVDRERIFEPFYRGARQPTDAVRGTGIGLSIVQEYIAAHGGRITLLPNAPGTQGAHFRIELPHAN